MPSLTIQTQDLVATGPVVEILIGPSRALVDALRAQGQPAPTPVAALAMIDTGSAGTVIRHGIAQALGIHPVGTALMSTPSTQTPVTTDVYNVGLAIRNHPVAIPQAVVIEATLGGQNLDCLIGRDILQHGVLVYLGHINQFTLSF